MKTDRVFRWPEAKSARDDARRKQNYLLVELSNNGQRIESIESLGFEDDQAAITYGEQLYVDKPLEVWKGDIKIASSQPDKEKK